MRIPGPAETALLKTLGAAGHSGHSAVELIDAYAHELAEGQRAQAERRCVNDSDGDGNCAACARNPQAPCRQLTPEGRTVVQTAGLIDPEVK